VWIGVIRLRTGQELVNTLPSESKLRGFSWLHEQLSASQEAVWRYHAVIREESD